MIDYIRQKENLHIYFWLLKDFFWSMEIKIGGLLMIIPTIALAFYILYLNRTSLTEKIHNLAVCFWIIANALWMIGEFFKYDLRMYSAILFVLGIIIISIHYTRVYLIKNKINI